MSKHGRSRKRVAQFERRIDETCFNAILSACTFFEMTHPSVVLNNSSRVLRIAQGSGRKVADVRLLFKLMHSSPAIDHLQFYVWKADSLAAAYTRQFGEPITGEDVLRIMKEQWEERREAPPAVDPPASAERDWFPKRKESQDVASN